MGRPLVLQNDADQSAGALVDDALECLLELGAGVVGHALELAVQILADQLMEGLAEDIGLPDGLGVPLELLKQEDVYKRQSSSRSYIMPVGLEGLLSRMALVLGVMAAESFSAVS